MEEHRLTSSQWKVQMLSRICNEIDEEQGWCDFDGSQIGEKRWSGMGVKVPARIRLALARVTYGSEPQGS